ncbi:MAG: hypothetical protein AAGC82_10525 [Pseudomonadota bacterium]
MSRALRIPGLVDVITVSDPAMVEALAADPDLDRTAKGGPLLVRVLRHRTAAALSSPQGPLPSAMPRDDAERHKLRDALAAQLSDPDLDAALVKPVASAATFVAGGAGQAGTLAQTIFGRVFVADFTANDDSWTAAEIIGRAVGTPSLKGLIEALTAARLGAQVTLSRAMHGDRNGIHAIGVAVHNFATMLELMRALDRTTPLNQALAKTLLPPERVARQGMSIAETRAGRLRPGTFVILETRTAGRRRLDPAMTFLSGSWSGCPAHAFVPKIAAQIWRQAGGRDDD